MASILDLTDSTYDAEVAKTGRTLIVLFWTEGEAGCRVIMPTFEELANEYSSFTFARLAASISSTAAATAGVRAFPTILALKDGQRVGQILGARPKADIARALDAL